MAKILLVEDDLEIAQVALECLSQKNHVAEHAKTASDAFDRLAGCLGF
jgi:CheY-like chemotaxis protein